jgi:hypothetical protein
MAPPSDLTPEIREKVIAAIRAGNFLEIAIAFAGIPEDVFRDWLHRGQEEEQGPYRDFCGAIDQALAEAEVRDVALIGQVAKEKWQAAAWRLIRRFPERWGQPGVAPSVVSPRLNVIRSLRKLSDLYGQGKERQDKKAVDRVRD